MHLLRKAHFDTKLGPENICSELLLQGAVSFISRDWNWSKMPWLFGTVMLNDWVQLRNFPHPKPWESIVLFEAVNVRVFGTEIKLIQYIILVIRRNKGNTWVPCCIESVITHTGIRSEHNWYYWTTTQIVVIFDCPRKSKIKYSNVRTSNISNKLL